MAIEIEKKYPDQDIPDDTSENGSDEEMSVECSVTGTKKPDVVESVMEFIRETIRVPDDTVREMLNELDDDYEYVFEALNHSVYIDVRSDNGTGPTKHSMKVKIGGAMPRHPDSELTITDDDFFLLSQDRMN